MCIHWNSLGVICFSFSWPFVYILLYTTYSCPLSAFLRMWVFAYCLARVSCLSYSLQGLLDFAGTFVSWTYGLVTQEVLIFQKLISVWHSSKVLLVKVFHREPKDDKKMYFLPAL